MLSKLLEVASRKFIPGQTDGIPAAYLNEILRLLIIIYYRYTYLE